MTNAQTLFKTISIKNNKPILSKCSSMLWNTLTVQNQYDLFKIIGFSGTIKWKTWMLDLKGPIIDLVEHLKTIYMWADFLQSKYNVTDYLKQ